MEKWFVETKKADFERIGEKFHISPIVARLLRNRDIETDEEIEFFLHGTRQDLYDPFLLKDMDKAVETMLSYLAKGKRIRIIGDYDIDGVCSSYILQKGIAFVMQFVFEQDPGALLSVRIPHRISDGYGLNDRLIQEASDDGVDLIITCDNGIAAYDQIAYANEQGIAVVITDHHEVPYDEVDGRRVYRVPPAKAIVDPKQEDCTYPFEGICGGVVAYKFVEALLSTCKKQCDDALFDGKARDVLEDAFAFAAFATIGDVMELKDENHIFVKYGLPSIAASSNPGLQALIEQSGLKNNEITTYHVGFVLGPCFNASGRLDSADRVLELLNTSDYREAMLLATELRELNAERQDLTQKGLQKAIDMVENGPLKEDKVLVAYLPDVHESLAGIIAGKLRERFYKPVFVLTDGEDGIKGSGRSIDSYHMYDEMTKIKDVFSKYGGHKLAAGLSLPAGSAEIFRQRVNDACTLTEDDFVEKVMIDIPMPIDYVSDDLLSQMALLEPYGMGNKKPLFAQKNVVLKNPKAMGKAGNVVKCLVLSETGRSFDAIRFCDGPAFVSECIAHQGRANIVYSAGYNTFRGVTSIQLEIKHIQFV